MECSKMTEHRAYPVFYDVEPTDVRKQSGAFGEAFHQVAAGKWREFIQDFMKGHEAMFIERIVKHISLELHSNSIYADRNLVGMEPRIEKVLASLKTSIDDCCKIGIKGIGGGGKTTLARALFHKLSIQFEGKSFVENVKGASNESVLKLLQERVISDFSNERDIKVISVQHGKNLMKNMLWGRKVLIVLDDVDHINQLEALAGELDWFKAGSRIIITTRDEQVLKQHGVKLIHDVDLLTDEEATCLFSRYAFRQDSPTPEYEELSRKAVHYSHGLPLLIRVLGLFLCGKDMPEWIDQLERLKKYPLMEAYTNWEISYISLEDDLKEIFLDVACFLEGLPKDDAIRILESCGFNAKIGLRVLELKSLITISNDQCLSMHDCIQDMGRFIVRRCHPHDPSKHSRLWMHEEIEEILSNGLGTAETIGLLMPYYLSSESVAQGLGNMKSLRFLQMVSKKDVNAHQVNQNFTDMLCYLSWDYYPHSSLPQTFQPYNLVALEMPDCRIEKLWEGEEMKVLKKLRFLVLRYSNLKSLDLGLTPNLEKLDLEDCGDLVNLNVPNGCLQNLVSLNLNGCSRIESLLFISELGSLKDLHLTCLSLEKFPYIIPGPDKNSLLELWFTNNIIVELPSSIGNLKKLVYLDLKYCNKLRHLPESICDLQHLRTLELHGCILEELPKDIGRLECLEKVNVSSVHIRHLPESICKLKCLKTLNLLSCSYLQKLPEDLGHLECLQVLNLTECSRVRDS